MDDWGIDQYFVQFAGSKCEEWIGRPHCVLLVSRERHHINMYISNETAFRVHAGQVTFLAALHSTLAHVCLWISF